MQLLYLVQLDFATQLRETVVYVPILRQIQRLTNSWTCVGPYLHRLLGRVG